MILTVDVGNTNILAVILDENNIVCEKRYDTGKNKDYNYHFKVLYNLTNNYIDEMKAIVISSVVPEINIHLVKACEMLTGKKPLVLNSELNTGMTICYDYPDKLGSDLIAGAMGALAKYEPPLIMIDIGTATTFSVISNKREYLGGMIAPGPYTSLNSLASAASQLPVTDLGFTDKIIGTNTLECMSIGVFTAHAAMIDGMINKVKDNLGLKNITIVATGGPAKDITKMCKNEIFFEKYLLNYGLLELYKLNK